MGVRFPVGARRLSRRIDVLQRVELGRSTIEPRVRDSMSLNGHRLTYALVSKTAPKQSFRNDEIFDDGNVPA